MTCVAVAAGRIGEYDLKVRTPAEAASLVAGGCGCEDEEREGFSAFAVSTETPAQWVPWSGVIGREGELTGDGRLIVANALRWENLPIPLRYSPIDNGGHDGAVVVGRILTLERRPNGDIWGTGDIDVSNEFGRECAAGIGTKAEPGMNRGVSMDLDDVSFEIRVAREILEEEQEMMEDGPAGAAEDNPVDEDGRVVVISIDSGDEVMATTDARVRAATVVQIPAFSTALIALDSATPNEGTADDPAGEAPALVAGGYPMEPPAAWFEDPQLTGPTPLTITPDGRVFGHLAVWGTCHTAFSGQCVEPPHSPSGYAYFRTGAVLTAEGREVSVGQITLDTMHAGRTLSAVDTLAHYEHTGKAAADIAVGDDVWGIWFSGALRPGLTDEKVRSLRASPLSGDWRRMGGQLEMVGALSVNVQGFPVPRAQGLVASGAMHSLVASGMLAPSPEGELPQQQLAFDETALADRIFDRLEQRDRQREASALAARTRPTRAAVTARQVGVR